MEEHDLPASATPLISAPDLVGRAVPLERPICGVYFLILEGRIVYVGQSIDIAARIITHSKRLSFDSWTHIECAREELNAIERAYLDAFLPERNRDPITRGLRGDPALLKRLSMERVARQVAMGVEPALEAAPEPAIAAPEVDLEPEPEAELPTPSRHEAQVEWMRRLRAVKANPALSITDFGPSPFGAPASSASLAPV